jgi:putative spermidine/putrescine transport system ATP-binding protein
VFKDGRIEQLGTPAEVYEHPETEFVAGFVGVSNVLERTLNGQPSRFTVRPEKIHMLDEHTAAEPGAHSEIGRIRAVVYVGMVTRYSVELDEGGELMVIRQNLETTSSEALEAQGRRVRLAWRPEHTYVIESGEEEEEQDE